MPAISTILIDGLTYASWLFIVALGLTLVFGVLKILNMAHGSFYALGAYAAASFVGWGASLQLAPAYSLVAMLLAGAWRWRRSWRRSPNVACCACSTAATRCCWCSSPTRCS